MSTNEHSFSYGQNSPATVIAALLALGAVLLGVLGFGSGSLLAGIAAVLLALGAIAASLLVAI